MSLLQRLAPVLVLLMPAMSVPAADPPPRPNERPLRYAVEDGAFVIRNGGERFNRPLYGGNTGFRVDAGDRPTFALFKPGRAGVVRFAVAPAGTGGAIWLDQAARIVARYQAGVMAYEIQDPAIPGATVALTVTALAASAGVSEGAGPGMAARLTVSNGKTLRVWWATAPGDASRGRRNGDLGGETVPLAVFHDLQAVPGAGVEFPPGRFQLLGPIPLAGGVPAGATASQGDGIAWKSANDLLATLGKPGRQPLAVVAGTLTPERPFTAIVRLLVDDRLPDGPALAPGIFDPAVAECRRRAGRLGIETPDPLINAAAQALTIAADAIWDAPSGTYQHGACGWRVPLLGWRGTYAGDAYGWPERTAGHFAAYAATQNVDPVPAALPQPDPKHHLARREPALATQGNLSRNLLHYDMNLVAVDAWFRHLEWTGDREEIRRFWPVLERHLAWERRLFRRTFGAERLPLYEAYACIWASDELIYHGGGVTHASAYNLWHLRTMARLATLIGQDPAPYQAEADLLARGLREHLWLADRGAYAENKDLLGLQAVHPDAGVWTFYHAVDSRIASPLDAWQMVRAMEIALPRIPLTGKGVPAGRFVQATTSWMPYVWSINNVALAESAHAALACWQAGRSDLALQLLQGALTDHMQLGRCPGNAGMTSATDVGAKETYRDFADSTGIAGRALVEGLFGVAPDALAGEIVVKPGFPAAWDRADLGHPAITVGYRRHGDLERYDLNASRPLRIRLQVAARGERLVEVTVDGVPTAWTALADAVGTPRIEVIAPAGGPHRIAIRWTGRPPIAPAPSRIVVPGDSWRLDPAPAQALELADPQRLFAEARVVEGALDARIAGTPGHHTAFLRVAQGDLRWWQPISLEVRPALEVLPVAEQTADGLRVRLRNNRPTAIAGTIRVAGAAPMSHVFAPTGAGDGDLLNLPAAGLRPGSHPVTVEAEGQAPATAQVANWRLRAPDTAIWDTVDLRSRCHDRVDGIFSARYLEPRSPFCSLALPWQGIGGWCHYEVTAAIATTGLEQASAQHQGRLPTPFGVPFRVNGDAKAPDVVFTSRWANHPAEATVPLSGTAARAYLLMTGSTNPMQCRFTNGEVVVTYADGTTTRLALTTPTTWWPIDQDYRVDGLAFRRPDPVPPRVRLATGVVEVRDPADLASAGPIAGGGAIILDLPLDPAKPLQSLTVRTLGNDVVIGLMALTLER